MENIKETKERILDALEGKRTEAVWELIEKAVKEIYEKDDKIDFAQAKEEYLKNEKAINNPENRFLIVEQYNIEDGFYWKFYEDMTSLNNGKIAFESMFDDYFSDCGGSEEILCVDMKERKCYLIDKEVEYVKKEVKINV